MIDKLYSEVSKLITDKIVTTLKEEGPKVAFKNLYIVLPLPVRLVIKEESFIKFCMDNKDRLFGKAVPAKAAKKVAVKKKTPVKKTIAAKKSAPKKASSKK